MIKTMAEEVRGLKSKMIAPYTAADERPWGYWYNEYGVKMALPLDPVSILIYSSKGFTLRPPAVVKVHGMPDNLSPEAAEAWQKAQETWDGKPIDTDSIIEKQEAPATAAPLLLTYYTTGGKRMRLPGDAASMAGYLAAGLSLDRPSKKKEG